MTFFKTVSLNAVATAFKMLSALITNKLAAVYIGPAGVALVGQFVNFISIINIFASGGLSSSITKYGAQYKSDPKKFKTVIGSAVSIMVVMSLLLTIIVSVLCVPIAKFLFDDSAYAIFVLVSGMAIISSTFNILINSLWNSLHKVRTMVIVNIIGSVISVILAIVLVIPFKIKGAIAVFVVSQIILSVVTLIFVKKEGWFSFSLIRPINSAPTIKKHMHFSAMAFTSLLMGIGVQFFIRRYIANELSYDSAGMWQGMNRISEMFLLVITTSLNIYYIPKLSSLHSKKELKSEMYSAYKMLVPALVVFCLLIWFSRRFIISILFSPEFIEMESLFAFQLIGDFLKICSFLIATLTIAKAMTKVFIFLEVFLGVMRVMINVLFINYFGLTGAVASHTLLYFINFIIMIILLKKIFNSNSNILKNK